MKNIIVLLVLAIAGIAFADRSANQEWVKRNFAPTNMVPRVENLEEIAAKPTMSTNDVKNIVRNESSFWNFSNQQLTNTIAMVIDDNITNVAAIVNTVTTNAVETAMTEMVGEGWKTKYGGGAAGIIAAILAALVWLRKNKANKSESISGVNINGSDLSVDTASRKASGTVLSCNPFPTGTVTGIGTSSGVTTLAFCDSLAKNTSVVAGMMYLGQVRLTEGVNNPDVIPNQSEVTVKCIKAVRDNLNPEDPEDFNGVVILVLDMTSTNQGCRHWMTVYEKFGKQNGSDYTQYPNGKIAFGNADKPWYGMLYTALDDQAGAQDPLEAAFIAASKADVTVKGFQTSGSGSVVTDVAVDSSTGMMTVTLGNASVDAATDSEIEAGTVSNKVITPSNATHATAYGLIHNAESATGSIDLNSTQQKNIHSWLGTMQLTFTFSDNTVRTFNFVCDEVVS